jgi:diguanylate cyclase (GGDEF)-like protein
LWSDEDGLLWVATDRGLNLRHADGGLQWVGYDPQDPNSLSDDSLLALYQDRAGVLWVGTSSAGLNKLAGRPSPFEQLRENPADPGSLASNRVTAIAEDRAGTLWVGTFDAGLNWRDPVSGRFSSLRPTEGREDILPDPRVMSLAVDREDRLWVGTLAGGLTRVDHETGEVASFRHDPGDPRSLSYDGVTAILEDPSGDLWVGTYRGGLNRFEHHTSVFRRYPGGTGGLSSPQVRALALESADELWVGTGDAGLDLLAPASGDVLSFRHDPTSPSSLRSDAVLSLLLAADGTLWIGTTEGLEGWPAGERAARRPAFRHYDEVEGLLGSPVWGILEDARGSLWLSTNRGLSRFDPRTKTFTNFGRSHGLPREGFKFGAYLEGADGTLYFGSNSGVTAFDPTRFAPDLHRPAVVVTQVFRDNQPHALSAIPGRQPRVELDYRTNVIAFDLAVLDFLAPELNRFEHKLEGFDPDWTDLSEGRRATYTNLPAGEYTLWVRGANSEGVWSSAEPALHLTVQAPPWGTWWAYALYGLTAAGVLLLYSHQQTRKLQREAEYARRLELEVQARTHALEEQNERLQYANRLLEIASVTDSLTGVHNRRFLLTSVERDIAQIDRLHSDAGARGETEPAVFLFLICDLDGFKEINDRHGHSAGDVVLFQIRDLLSRACRSSDTLVRWGGDEFMIVGRSASREHIEVLAERIRSSVSNHLFDIGIAQAVHLTCSIGFAAYPFVGSQPRLYSWEDVVELADRALFLAKRRGPDMWVGVFGTERTPETPFEDFLALVSDRPELLAAEGSIVVRSSPSLAEASLRTGT